MILFLTLLSLLCDCKASDDWIDEYNKDPRPYCPTELDGKRLDGRIVGGKDAGAGTFPFAVEIIMGSPGQSNFRTDDAFCGGTMITDIHVLTAAHCLYKNQYFKEYLWLNVNDYDTQREDERRNYLRSVERIVIHPRYSDENFNNDICIITLNRSVPFDEGVRTAILPPFGRKLDPGIICTVWGWGRLSYEGQRPNVMQKVDLPITSREDCQKHMKHTITENMICAGGKEGEDACLGDSGGSLLSRDDNVYCLAGIVSFGKGCALKDISGVYTNVAMYTDWIFEGTRDAACKPRIYQ